MERFELAITVLLVVLVMICVYIAASWTLWRKQKKKGFVEEWLDKESSAFRKGFVPEGEEGLPKITITPIQPRPDISNEVSITLLSSNHIRWKVHSSGLLCHGKKRKLRKEGGGDERRKDSPNSMYQGSVCVIDIF